MIRKDLTVTHSKHSNSKPSGNLHQSSHVHSLFARHRLQALGINDDSLGYVLLFVIGSVGFAFGQWQEYQDDDEDLFEQGPLQQKKGFFSRIGAALNSLKMP